MTRFESQVRSQRGTMPAGAIPLGPTRAYLALVRFWAEKGRAPVLSELARICDTTKVSIHKYIHQLVDAGMVEMDRGRNGTIRPLCFPVPLQPTKDHT